jgi:hypothetical protein
MTIFTGRTEFHSLSATTESDTAVASTWHLGINLDHNGIQKNPGMA